MNRVVNRGASAKRAEWLAELAEALDSAGFLVRELGLNGPPQGTLDLHARIEAVRLEVEVIRLARSPRGHFDPEWTKNIPWTRGT